MIKRLMMDSDERIFSTVRNFVEYGYYKKSESLAIKTLSKHLPEIGIRDCTTSFRNAVRIYKEASDDLDKNIREYREEKKNTDIKKLLERQIELSEGKNPDTSKKLIGMIVYWLYHWHYER